MIFSYYHLFSAFIFVVVNAIFLQFFFFSFREANTKLSLFTLIIFFFSAKVVF